MEVRGGGAKRDRSGKTCEQCRVAHAACDKERPCRRCRRLGDDCGDQQHRKRGRAAANRNGQPSVTDHHDNAGCLPHCGNSDQPQQPSQPHLQLEDLLGFDFSATASHDHHPLHDEATTTTTATATAQHHAQHAGQVGDRAVHYSYDHRQQQLELQEQRIRSLENRLEVLTRLVHTMGNDLRELHQANALLRAKRKRRQVVAKSSSSDRRSAPEPSGTASAAAFTATIWPATSSSSPSSSSSSPPLSSSSSSTSPSTSSSPSSSSSHPFIVERRPSFAFELSVLHSGVSPVLAMEARRQLPWLLHYDIPPRFSIVDFSHPICVMETMSSLDVPACVSYANAAFLALSGYAWGELIGSPHTQIFSFRRSYLDLSAILYNQRPMTASDVFSFSQLLRRKDGRTVRLDDQSQVFYDRNGNGQYNVICVLGWKEDGLMPGEAFDTWLPLRPPATVAVQTSALPASRVNPASTRTTTSSMTPAMSAPPAPVGTAERSRPASGPDDRQPLAATRTEQTRRRDRTAKAMDLVYHLQHQPKHAPTSSRPSACTACRDAHTACDLGRPCARCTRLGKPHLCSDAPPRKRVRGAAAAGGKTSSSTHQTANGSKRQAKETSYPNAPRHLHHQITPQAGPPPQPQPHQQQPPPPDAGPAAWMNPIMTGADGDHHGRQQPRPATTMAAFYHELYAHQLQHQHQQQPQPQPQPQTQPQTQQQQDRPGEATQALEDKVDRLTRLVETMQANMARLERSNAELVSKVAKLEDVVHLGGGGGGGSNDPIDHRNGHVIANSPLAELLTSSSPSVAPGSSPLFAHQHHLRLEAGVSPALAMEARQNLPWLCHYDLPSRFAVSSFSMYPVCVMEQRYTWELPTVLAYANPAFAELCQYQMDELIGAYYTKLFSLPANVQCYGSVLYNQRPMAVSEIISFQLLLRRSDGVTLRMRDQSQLFYNSEGQAQYVVMCFHGWQAGPLTQDEVLGQWVPLPNPLDPPSSSSRSSSSFSSSSLAAASPSGPPLRHAPSPSSSASHARFAPVVESWSSSPADLADSAFDLLDQFSSWPPTPTTTNFSSSSSSSSSTASQSSSSSLSGGPRPAGPSGSTFRADRQ